MPRASGGRPSLAGSRRSIAAAAREYGPEALEILAEVMRDTEAPPGARIDAASKLIDRGFGKATEYKHAVGVDEALAELSDDELTAALAVLRSAGRAPNGNGAGTETPLDPSQLN